MPAGSSQASASQGRPAGLELPRQAAGIAYRSPNALPASAVVLDAPVARAKATADQVTVEHGHGAEAGALLVGADGIRSTVRSQLWPTAKPPVYAGYTTWRFITPRLDVQPVASETWGRGERVGIVPLNDGSVYSYLTASVPPDRPYLDELEELRRRFGRWHDPIPAILESLSGAEVLRHDIYRLPRLRGFVIDRAALVGDAAHAMTPDFGQGGGTALEDAVELGEALDLSNDIESGLRDYDRRRRRRTQSIARQSALFGTVARWAATPAVATRNLALRMLPPRVLLRSLRPMLSWRA